MRKQPGFFDVDDRLRRLSDLGDQLEAFRAAVDFEMFRPDLVAALSYSDGAQGGRPPFDPVMMFKILVIQVTNNLSDERAEFLINDACRSCVFSELDYQIASPTRGRFSWSGRNRRKPAPLGVCSSVSMRPFGDGRGSGDGRRMAKSAVEGELSARFFFDALRVKIRDEGLVRNKAVYIALGVQADGTKDILGLWIENTEGAKFWLRVMNEPKNRGVNDVLVAIVDGSKGFPEAINAVFPQTTVQTCIVHLIRFDGFRLLEGPQSPRRRAEGDLSGEGC